MMHCALDINGDKSWIDVTLAKGIDGKRGRNPQNLSNKAAESPSKLCKIIMGKTSRRKCEGELRKGLEHQSNRKSSKRERESISGMRCKTRKSRSIQKI